MLHAIPERVMAARTLLAEGRLNEAAGWVQQYDWRTPVHQVGGYPILDQPLKNPACDFCGRPMPFLASVAGTPVEPVGEEAPAQMLFYLCRGCRCYAGHRVP
jgi:hypothetical protein